MNQQSNSKGLALRALDSSPVRLAILIVLMFGCVLLTSYCHFVEGVEVVYTHLFYVPIVLAGLWWCRWSIMDRLCRLCTWSESRRHEYATETGNTVHWV